MERPNLEVRTGATVLGVELDGDRAVGVRLRKGRSGEELVRAGHEVLLCAGAINSPQLLLLSGIGPAEELRAAGVEVSALAILQCCISDPVASIVRDAGAPQVMVARSPDENALFETLDRALRP